MRVAKTNYYTATNCITSKFIHTETNLLPGKFYILYTRICYLHINSYILLLFKQTLEMNRYKWISI